MQRDNNTDQNVDALVMGTYSAAGWSNEFTTGARPD
jgi:hypothetical protein